MEESRIGHGPNATSICINVGVVRGEDLCVRRDRGKRMVWHVIFNLHPLAQLHTINYTTLTSPSHYHTSPHTTHFSLTLHTSPSHFTLLPHTSHFSLGLHTSPSHFSLTLHTHLSLTLHIPSHYHASPHTTPSPHTITPLPCAYILTLTLSHSVSTPP